MKTPIMKCGCAANSKRIMKDGSKVDSCLTHSCIDIADTQPNLDGRIAKCSHHPSGGKYGKCENPKPSNSNLAFFKYTPEKETDTYYCGCWGWD